MLVEETPTVVWFLETTERKLKPELMDRPKISYNRFLIEPRSQAPRGELPVRVVRLE